MIKPIFYPQALKTSELYSIKVHSADGKQFELPVFENIVSDFASIEFDEEVFFEVSVRTFDDLNPKDVSVRPVSRGIDCVSEGRKVTFSMKRPENIKLDILGLHDLFIYCTGTEIAKPDPNSENIIYFASGQTYEVGRLELKSNQTLYIEAGAIVCGSIHGVGENIKIMGRGIIDGGSREGGPLPNIHTIQLEECTNALIQDVIIINPMRWIVVLGACEGVVCRNIKELGYNMSTDGIDVCGSKNVFIEDCFIKCNDDCVVIKALLHSNGRKDWRRDVENITTKRCVFQTIKNGAIMEIGHELIADTVQNITFEDCDVLGVHGFGSVFSIQNTDRAIVSKVRYQNIRVEHCFDKLVNIRIMNSRYSKNTEKGQIRDVVFKDVFWSKNEFNIGYTISLVGGLSEDNTVEGVEFDNFQINGVAAENLDDLNLFSKYCKNIIVKN